MPETLYVFLSYKYLGINLFTPMYNIHCIFKIVNIHFIFLSSYDRQTCVEPCSRVSIIPAAPLCPVVIITHSQLYMFHQQSLVKVPSSHQSVEQQQLSQLDPFFACSDFVLSWSPARYRWHLWGLSSKAWLISTAATWAPTKSTLWNNTPTRILWICSVVLCCLEGLIQLVILWWRRRH